MILNVKQLNWRYGEWPGMLREVTRDNKVLSLRNFTIII